MEMVFLNEGERLAHFVGPLGTPLEMKKYGTVVCGGGCFGVGAILPIARALKKAGNKVICIEEASSSYLLYLKDELSAHCDELIIATKDGTDGIKGGVQEAISMLAERGERIDQAFIVGCTFMMMLVSEVTKKLSIPTLTALNPIMIDGTGMCGACRVTLGEETKFACVDGPFLDGHLVDWIELMQRRSAYTGLEIQALPQDHQKYRHMCVEL
jgi:NAD(P)H-flavin reductase